MIKNIYQVVFVSHNTLGGDEHMLSLEVIRKYYPNLSDEDLKRIQVFVYELCCGLMQYFYGDYWEKDIDDSDLKNKEG